MIHHTVFKHVLKEIKIDRRLKRRSIKPRLLFILRKKKISRDFSLHSALSSWKNRVHLIFLSSKPLVVLLLLLMSLHFTYTDKYILCHLNKGILPVLQLLSLPLRLNNTTKYKFLLLHAAKHTSYVAFKQWLLPFRYSLSKPKEERTLS